MNEGKGNIVVSKSYEFASERINVYKFLCSTSKEFVLSNQLLRSGTSIGANVNEAVSSESKRDFIHKLSIALKEARETTYWLHLLQDSNYLKADDANRIINLSNELIRIISSIILTTKQKYFPQKIHNS